MSRETVGVLLMAYGTPESLDDVEAYYTHIRGGRTPSPELVEDLKARYRAIGGRSPLLDITRAQAAALETRLNAGGGDVRFRCYVGMKHAPPFVADAVASCAADGIGRAVGLALTPQYSRMSVGSYIQAARNAAARLGRPLAMSFVDSWHLQPHFVDVLARRLDAARAGLGSVDGAAVKTIFTAHSLPNRIVETDDPYPRQLIETSQAVADRAAVTDWTFAYQSAGKTAVPWLGPDIGEVLHELPAAGYRAALVCPVGFVADHLEILYDLDVECREIAASLGIRLARTESLNADPHLIGALAAVVREQMAKGEFEWPQERDE